MSFTREQLKEDRAQSDREFGSLVCKQSPAGVWVVNKSKLKAIVKAGGLRFVDATASVFPVLVLDSSDCRKPNAVFLLKKSQVLRIKGESTHNLVAYVARGRIPGGIFAEGVAKIERVTSQWRITKWIHGEADNCCVVCYEKHQTTLGLERTCVACVCGSQLCFGCCIDLLLIGEKKMTLKCPNCRDKRDPIQNFYILLESTSAHLARGDILGEISEAHLEFIEEITGIDLTLAPERAVEQVNDVYSYYYTVLGKVNSEANAWIPPKLRLALYKKMRQFIDRKRKKKKVVRASAEDSSSAFVTRSSDGCANCGKQFWDKLERRRAPKCAKCRRTAYCSAKCRKKHWKTHKAECSSTKGAKKKRKTKKKKKTTSCDPY